MTLLLHRPTRHPLTRILLVMLATQMVGCMAYSRRGFDVDRTPIVNMGTRATIIYPGQAAPMLPSSAPPGYTQQGLPGQAGATTQRSLPLPPGAPPQAPGQAPGYSAEGAPQGAGGYPAPPRAPRTLSSDQGMTFLGGARVDEQRHLELKEDPIALKYLTAPLAIVAAPFVMAKRALTGDPEPGPPIPRRSDPNAPVPGTARAPTAPHYGDYESVLQQQLAREIQQRNENSARSRVTTPPIIAVRPEPGMSIAEELAALERTPLVPTARAEGAPSPSPVSRSQSTQGNDLYPTANGIIDRNDDGRIDHWIFRNDGEISRQVFDEDFDGRPDRTVHFDPTTHRIDLVEEDTRGDGNVDSWTDYRDGELVRRRADTSGDGRVDTWSFFRGGQLARHEQDTSQDGYRDSISFYEAGKLVREERDSDGDGQVDARLFYDENEELIRSEELQSRDGHIERVSHYRNGRLYRRELLDTRELAEASEGEPSAVAR